MTRLRMFLKIHTAVIASGAKQSLSSSVNHSEIASSPAAPRNDLFLSNLMALWRISLVVFACVLAAPVLVYAHGGMGLDEIGPPIMTSGLLGFVGYWAVMLWPSAKKKNDQGVGASGPNSYAPRTDGRPPKRSVHVKRKPRLRKIEGNGQFSGDQNARRRASDG
jgi:hypothetical protein